jgi:hypothetical protein
MASQATFVHQTVERMTVVVTAFAFAAKTGDKF